MLLSEVNIAYYQALTVGARAAIAAGRLAEFHATTKAGWDWGELLPNSNSISRGLDAPPPPTHNRIIQGKMRSARCHLQGDSPWRSA
jgi:hypothetical protein